MGWAGVREGLTRLSWESFQETQESLEKGRFEEMLCPSGSAASQAERPYRAVNNSRIDLRARWVQAGCARGCQGQSESGVPWLTHHRVPRLCRVGCGRDSQETAAQSSLFSPGRVKRASARESSCQTPEVGRQREAGGSGVTLSLRVGSRPRVTKRGAKQCDLTVSPVTKTRVSHTTRERARVPDAQHEGRRTGCARACATARHTHVVSWCFKCHSATRHAQST